MHLPQDAIRCAALTVLTLIGLGLIVPSLQHLLERPFAAIRLRQTDSRRTGFGLGLTLGALYVPCAGPVLVAIVAAGGTSNVGPQTLVLTATSAAGNAVPLLAFALAGRQVTERVAAFRRRQRTIRIWTWVTMIVLAVALVFNLSALLQRAIPDYSMAVQDDIGANDIPCIAPERTAGVPQLLDPKRHQQGPSVRLRQRICATAGLRAGTRSCRHDRVAQHAGRQADRSGVVARQGLPDRLLRLLVHQLPTRSHTRSVGTTVIATTASWSSGCTPHGPRRPATTASWSARTRRASSSRPAGHVRRRRGGYPAIRGARLAHRSRPGGRVRRAHRGS